jgi:hypothetical protein
MNAKRFIIGTLAGSLALFLWETVSNAAIPWHQPTMRHFADSSAVLQTIRANAPDNGMYVDARGLVAAVSMSPDLSSKASLLGLMLGRQFVLDLMVAALVLIVFTRMPRGPTRQYALTGGGIALAVAASAFASDWNWYGFGAGWTLVNIVDRSIGYTLMCLVLGALINKWSVRSTTDEWGGVRASGSMQAAKTTPRSASRI